MDDARDHVRLWPALMIHGGFEVALEVEVHGAYVTHPDGHIEYEAREERKGRSEPVIMAMQQAFEVLAAHRRKQKEEQG